MEDGLVEIHEWLEEQVLPYPHLFVLHWNNIRGILENKIGKPVYIRSGYSNIPGLYEGTIHDWEMRIKIGSRLMLEYNKNGLDENEIIEFVNRGRAYIERDIFNLKEPEWIQIF